MTVLQETLSRCIAASEARNAFWSAFLRETGVASVAEVGVWKGQFAEQLLKECPAIERYVMIDPWRHLENWEKPYNVTDVAFESVFDEAMGRTEFAAGKREVLRQTTREAAGELAEGSLDFVYVDGDHTLRGITIDLVSMFSKVKPGGFLGGDDFTRSVWQHDERYEPTMVCPLAVYFAEAMNCPIFALPWQQFLIVNDPAAGFEFIRLAEGYESVSLRRQMSAGLVLKRALGAKFPALAKVWSQLKGRS
ncbi:MAG: class I SAM-dependent methyltransferase [Verrucomicrobiae bacterium]|nr:class I SAM-dependent methyltransferase [Verrucomicrobiae bacterium]MCB1092046.1 class I SAM-dependent methyltransferase [Verrucomicrobiae bacterium]